MMYVRFPLSLRNVEDLLHERKRRTRRLILMGSYLEHVTQDDPERKARLMKELDGSLERDRDRELFDLASKEVSK